LRILGEIEGSEMPLRGIVHAAGVADEAPLREQMLGALHLHALTHETALDFFVMCASGAGLLGTPGQGGATSAGASAFLDALAHHRRAEGLHGLCLDWGAFGEAGRGGMKGLDPEEARAAFWRLLDADATQAAVMNLDARQWVELYPAAGSSRRLSRILAAPRATKFGGDPELRRRLSAADPARRRALIEEAVLRLVARVLRIPEDELSVDAPFTSLGMTSLLGLELRNHVESDLGITLPATLLWTYPTVVALSRHLAEDPVFGEGRAPSENGDAPSSPTPTPEVELELELEEDGLFALIEEELALKRRRQET
jgi:acyl carrier protein